MAADLRPHEKSCIQLFIRIRTIFKSIQGCYEELRCHPVLRLADDDQEVIDRIKTAFAQVEELQKASRDISVPIADIEKLGDKRKDLERRMKREARINPLAEDYMQPGIDRFVDETRQPMEIIHNQPWVTQEGRAPSNRRSCQPPLSPDAIEGEESCGNFDDILFDQESLPPTPADTPRDKRPSPDTAEEQPSPKRRCIPTIMTEELDRDFPSQKVTETPCRSGHWYVFRCEDHDMLFNGLARPAQSAARHAMKHGLPSTHVSAVDAFGIKVIDCDAAHAKEHNDRVQKPREQSRSRAQNGNDPRQHDRPDHNDDEMAQLLGDVNTSHSRHQPVRRAAPRRGRVAHSREPDGALKPREIVACEIYWAYWSADGQCYPAYVLPWSALQRFRSKNCAPVDRGLLSTVDRLPSCYDRRFGFDGVWAEGYKDGQAKVHKRQWPVMYFTRHKRFPWGCETGFVREEDLRVYEGDKEEPRYKALVDNWLSREDRMTPDEELIRLDLMSPPPRSSVCSDRESSRSSSNDPGLPRRSMSSDQQSSRGGSSERDMSPADLGGDIGLALLGGSRRSQPRETSRLESEDTVPPYRRQRRHIPLFDDTPTPTPDRFLHNEGELSDIDEDENEDAGLHLDDESSNGSDGRSNRPNLEKSPTREWEFSDCEIGRESSPYSGSSISPSLNASSHQGAETPGVEEDEEDGERFDEPFDPPGRSMSSSQRVDGARDDAARMALEFYYNMNPDDGELEL
ncbi:hypothetical protein IL306_007416 [Fusarium sp. DS 682]|nr:hypothetical protein IL306_007416 [Fusarium sp. DS 682]